MLERKMEIKELRIVLGKLFRTLIQNMHTKICTGSHLPQFFMLQFLMADLTI
jgi:hypothetical protein